jgi:glycosyltransferase involved in cell wall biosynthesis
VFANLPKHMTDTVLLSSSNPPWLPHLCSYLQSNTTLHVVRVLDVYPDVLRSHPHMARWPLIQRLWRIANRLAYRRCTSVVTLGDVMATTLSCYTDDAPLVIPDWSTIDARKVPPRDENPLRVKLGLGDRLVVLYSGNLGLTHDLSPIIQAATHFKDDDRVRFVVVGEGPQHDRLQRDAQARGIGHLLVFLPYQSNDQLPLSMGLGDLSVVTIARGAENTCMPCKTYDYLAAGSAILAIAGRPSDLADIVDRYQCGVVIAPGDVSGLVRAIRAALPRDAWLQQMRAGARRAASQVFSAEIQCTRLVALLETTARQLRASQPDDVSARA